MQTNLLSNLLGFTRYIEKAERVSRVSIIPFRLKNRATLHPGARTASLGSGHYVAPIQRPPVFLFSMRCAATNWIFTNNEPA